MITKRIGPLTLYVEERRHEHAKLDSLETAGQPYVNYHGGWWLHERPHDAVDAARSHNRRGAVPPIRQCYLCGIAHHDVAAAAERAAAIVAKWVAAGEHVDPAQRRREFEEVIKG
jgi:hypothetical protein